jgi:hypothetical protein
MASPWAVGRINLRLGAIRHANRGVKFTPDLDSSDDRDASDGDLPGL